ncbi:fatty acyl-CoA reductase 1 isoform X1 [Temnothorax americanus]|uniref:fatty acyl-CoA reductase 1 isoform X1 n=2 Tax=Temnothorax americanus TaxID=1964332 RepID=UPI004068A1F6
MSPAFPPASKILSSRCARTCSASSRACGPEDTPMKLERKRERNGGYVEEPGAERAHPSGTINAHGTHCVELETDIKMGTTNAQTNSGHAHDEVHPRGGSIDAFFAETVILLTGATGFLGKALLEKLLRSCPRVATIFVLIRPKKDQSVEQRFQELLNNPVFDRIRSEFPGTLNKIFPVKGDVGLPELGLQPEDRDMLIQRVNIVFHSAATVRFNESLKIAVNLNTMGTDRMLDLCRRMTNLISVIHVSTAYSNADRREIEESIYITEVRPYTVVDMCENLDDETIGIIEKRLIGKHPNTYTLTKGLAEQIVMSKGSGLPIAIVRPSIVCAAYQEPFPGWIDNTCGITGIMTEIGRGTVRSIVCNAKLVVDVVPVDFVVNTLICASWHNAMQRTDTIKIYNCTSSTVNPITWGEFGYLVRKHAIESPSKYVMWYPGFTFRTNKFIHAIIVATLHFLPAFIVDLILRVQGCKPMMVKVAKRFERAAKTGEFFAMNEWKFYSGNMTKLVKFVRASEDCDNFDVDIRNVDWDMYLHQYMLGIRKYILKDNLDTLNNARNRLSRLYWMHKFTKILSIFALLGLIKCAGR